MQFNGIEVPADILEGLLRLSALRDAYGRTGHPQSWLGETPAGQRLGQAGLGFDWMLDEVTEYFTLAVMASQNALMRASIVAGNCMLAGLNVHDDLFRAVDPKDLVLIGYNLLGDDFFALVRSGNADASLALMALCRRDGVDGWGLVHENMTEFLRDARVDLLPPSAECPLPW